MYLFFPEICTEQGGKRTDEKSRMAQQIDIGHNPELCTTFMIFSNSLPQHKPSFPHLQYEWMRLVVSPFIAATLESLWYKGTILGKAEAIRNFCFI